MMREWLQEIWQYRQLFYFFAWRDVKVRYRQTLLGVAWAILQPLATMLCFVAIFARMANLPTDGIPPPIFYYAALVPWIYFSGTLSLCSNSLVSNANLLTKIYFPRTILPASVALSGLVDFGVGSILILGLLAFYGIKPDWHVVMWPLLALLLVLLTYGVGMILAALTVRFRDVKYATPFLIQLGLFGTPIIYSPSSVPEQYRSFLGLNPLAGIVDAFRSTLIPGQTIRWDLLSVSVIVTLTIVLVGSIYFRHAETDFADTI